MSKILFEKSWQKSSMIDAAVTVLNHDADPEMSDKACELYTNLMRSYLNNGIPTKKELKLCIKVLYSAINLFRFEESDSNMKRVNNYKKTVKFLLNQTA